MTESFDFLGLRHSGQMCKERASWDITKSCYRQMRGAFLWRNIRRNIRRYIDLILCVWWHFCFVVHCYLQAIKLEELRDINIWGVYSHCHDVKLQGYSRFSILRLQCVQRKLLGVGYIAIS